LLNYLYFLLFRALINITKDDGGSVFITMPFIHQMAPLYFAQLMYADYAVMLRIKWPCFVLKSEDLSSTSEVTSWNA